MAQAFSSGKWGREDTATREQATVLRVLIEPSGDSLPNFHEFVLGLLARRLRVSVAQNVAAAAAELLDNAMAYGTMTNDIEIEIAMDTLGVTIQVSNDTVASRIKVLEERIQKLSEDAEAVYLEEMRRSMAARGPRSMMGLARICHESEMELSLNEQAGRVTLVAHCQR